MKGFVFSIDALLAIGIAWLLLSLLSQIPSDSHDSELRWHRQAADLTVLFDKQKMSDGLMDGNSSLAQSKLDSQVASLLDSDLNARLEVQVFESTTSVCSSNCRLAGSSPTRGVCLCGWYNSSQGRPSAAASVFRRMAYVSGPPERMVLIRAWVWK